MIDSHPQRWAAPPSLRRLLAALVGLDLLSLFWFIGTAAQHARGASPLAVALAHPWTRGVLVGCGVLAALRFAGAADRWRAGSVALLLLGALTTLHADLAGGPARNLYFSGVCLLGWLCGLAWRRGDEGFARTGTIALLGAAYFSAGLSKLAYSGLPWLSGVQIQAIILSQDGLAPGDVVAPLRAWVALSPAVVRGLAVLTVGFELAGPLMLFGARLRQAVAFGLIAMHVCILLLGGIPYLGSMVLLAAVALQADPPTPPDPAPTPIAVWRFAGLVLVLALLAGLAVNHQVAAVVSAPPDYGSLR